MKFRKLLFIFKYYLFRHHKIAADLHSHGLTKIRAYRINRWYSGLGKTKTRRHYYKAELNGKKCFVKLSEYDRDIKREIFINKYITQCNLDFIPKILLSYEGDDNNAALLVTEFIESDARELKMPEDAAEFEAICAQLEYIHSCLSKFDIIHGDIHSSNMMPDKENNIKIIDCAIGWVPGSEAYDESYKNRGLIGTYYIKSGNTRIYDHAYAFLRMMDDLGISDDFKQKECYKRIESLVGVHTYTLHHPD
jgi:serine/threonine protein kinase